MVRRNPDHGCQESTAAEAATASAPGPVFKGHDLPRLRGVMSPQSFQDEDLRVLGQEWNANVIRWQITRNWGRAGTDRDLAEYDRWLDSELEDLDKALDASRRYGLKVVVDMHSPPGGRYETTTWPSSTNRSTRITS